MFDAYTFLGYRVCSQRHKEKDRLLTIHLASQQQNTHPVLLVLSFMFGLFSVSSDVISTLNPDAKAFTPGSGVSFVCPFHVRETNCAKTVCPQEPKPGSPASRPPILHSPVYAPVNPQIQMGHVPQAHAVQQPHSQFVATPVIGYTSAGQPVPGVPMQVSQYPPTHMPAQMRGMPRHHHFPPHVQMSHELPGSPIMTPVPGMGQVYLGQSPPIAYSPGPPQVMPVHSHGHQQVSPDHRYCQY